MTTLKTLTLAALAALAAATLATPALAHDDHQKCAMRMVMKIQTNIAPAMKHAIKVNRMITAQADAAIEIPEAAQINTLMEAAVKAAETVTKTPANNFVLQIMHNNANLLTTTLKAAVEAEEPVMQHALIDGAVQQVILAAMTPCDM